MSGPGKRIRGKKARRGNRDMSWPQRAAILVATVLIVVVLVFAVFWALNGPGAQR
ncbi:MAG TPA: hypothetical protein VII63_01800 [Caulobacteraceae bacterium]